jgi:hypothetical protein
VQQRPAHRAGRFAVAFTIAPPQQPSLQPQQQKSAHPNQNAGSEHDAGVAGCKIIGRRHLIDVTDCCPKREMPGPRTAATEKSKFLKT